MTQTTHQMIRQSGALAVVATLLFALLVVVFRLASIPFALATITLDRCAELAASPLNFTATAPDRRPNR
jgi:hypothetical protein